MCKQKTVILPDYCWKPPIVQYLHLILGYDGNDEMGGACASKWTEQKSKRGCGEKI
jgi:hypothetical protein